MGDKEKKKQVGKKLNEIELIAVEVYLGNRREEQVTFDSLVKKTAEKIKPKNMAVHALTIREYLNMIIPDIVIRKTMKIDDKEVYTLALHDKYVQGTVDLLFASITDIDVKTYEVNECECGGHLKFIARTRPEGCIDMYECEPDRAAEYWVCDACKTIFSRCEETPYGSHVTNYEDFKVYLGYTVDQIKRECKRYCSSLPFTR